MLLVLGLGWAGVLFFWYRSKSQGGLADSVGLFHRHLHVLARAAPGTLPAANRLRGPVVAPVPLAARQPGYTPPAHAGGRQQPVAAGYARRQRQGPPAYGRSRPQPVSSYGRSRPRPAIVAPSSRRRTMRRRRDVLFALAVAAVATLVMAVGTGSTTVAYLQVLSDAAIVGYVGMLVRLRNLSAEREMKLRVLAPTPARVGAAPAATRRRRPAASGYAYYAYGGDLALRRAAN